MFEAEADYLGLQYMYKAGYDPQALVTFFEKLDALEKHKPGTLARAFSDHPATPDRMYRSEVEIATIMPAKPDYIVTTSEFDDVKSRLARIENKRKINDKQRRQQAHTPPHQRSHQRPQQPHHQLRRRPSHPRPPQLTRSSRNKGEPSRLALFM